MPPSDQTPLRWESIPNTDRRCYVTVGIDTHTKTDNVYLAAAAGFFPVAKVMVQLVTNQRAITIMTTAKHCSDGRTKSYHHPDIFSLKHESSIFRSVIQPDFCIGSFVVP